MENTGFKIEFRIFYFIHLPNEKDYENNVFIFLLSFHYRMYTSIQPRKIVIESSNADAIRVSADTLAYEYTAWAFINKSVPIFLISHILLNQFT